MYYLLDTDVLSALRKRKRDPNVVAWIGSVTPADLFLSAVTIAEIERGIERQRTVNPTFADELAGWLDLTLRAYGERILPLTVNIARRWGRLAAQIGNQGIDLAVAATALEHGLTVVTRNVSDFEPTGVATLNPFNSLSRQKP
jgi:predicted nucleic acid-binding protein